MAVTSWATSNDLKAWGLVPLPDNAESLLRSATLLIARAVNQSPYDPGVVVDDPRRDATLAQAAAWAKANIDPAAGPSAVAAVVKSKAIGSGSITYDTPTAADREAAIANLAPDAYNILYAAGLLASVLLPVWNNPIDTDTYLTSRPNALGYGYGGY